MREHKTTPHRKRNMQNSQDWIDTLDPRLSRQLDFLQQLNALKAIYRASVIAKGGRHENSAEHSWHLAMYALVLSEYANSPVDTNRVITMLLLHDIVEIDAGDVPLHGPADPDREKKEMAAADRLYNLLPTDQAEHYRTLWDEFEAGASDDAKFAKALDRFQPIILNSQTEGGTWEDFKVSMPEVEQRTCSIEKGSETLWNAAKQYFRAAVKKGWLKPA